MRIMFLLMAAVGLVALDPGPEFPAEIEAITNPSGDVTLSFVRAGQIAKVLVKEGQHVKSGQVLVRQDDAVEQAQLAQLEAQAEDTTRIRAAKAQLDQRKVDLKRLQGAAERRAATEFEVEHARLDVMIAELSLELAQFQHQQDKRKYQEAKLQVERMRLISPIAGKVERVFVEVGESVDALAEVIRIVNIAPLWIDIPVPLKLARSLKCGQVAQVAFGEKDRRRASGRIIHVASVADAASDTLNVRVELANPTGRPAGERVYVSFTGSDSDAETEKAKRSHSREDPAPTKKKE